ncbi:MAG TPA: HAMP domain-containing protein [Anaerolineales bacterium]|nr:HAMP domain-containing protein [Anaerolineales bacterium]
MAKKGDKELKEKQQAEKIARKPLFVSLRWKLLIGFTLLFSLVFALAFYWFYTFATQQALTRIRADLLDVLQGAAGYVDGDTLASVAKDGQPNAAGQAWLAFANADENGTADASSLLTAATQSYGKGTRTGFSDDPRYQKLMDQLQLIHDIEPRAWPYLFVKAPGERNITYIADLWARYDPSKATPFMFTKSSKRSYNGLTELTLRLDSKNQFVPYSDQWGSWISAYRPILDSNGQIAGAIGIDFEAGYVDQVQSAIRDRVLVAFIITYAGLFLLVFLVSRTLTQPIQRLTVSAERLGEGDYGQDMTKHAPRGVLRDEIARLADIFAVMATKVYQREQTLRKQVEMLKIEIDESKKQKQVSEIADTDFFRELQAKASKMRKRREAGS